MDKYKLLEKQLNSLHRGYSKYGKPSGVADGGIRYIQDFNDLYSEYSVEIEDAPNGSNGFNQIIKVTL